MEAEIWKLEINLGWVIVHLNFERIFSMKIFSFYSVYYTLK